MAEPLILEGVITDKFVWGRGEMCQLKSSNGSVCSVEVKGESPKLWSRVKMRVAPGRFNHVSLSWEAAPEAGAKNPPVADMDGSTYEAKADKGRLNQQLQKVFETMSDGVYRTLTEIEETTKFPQASISARLRDLRKPKFGGYVVERRLRGPRSKGLFEYRLKL